MKNTLLHLKNKSKLILIPLIVLSVLVSVYFFSNTQNNRSLVVYAENGTFLEASGTVESNGVDISSEITGTVIESLIAEGDKIAKGDVIAKVGNTTVNNQYNQAKTNVKMAEKNIELLEISIKNLQAQNADAIRQAKNSYLAVSAEYEKIKGGASADEIAKAEEVVNQAQINRDYLKNYLKDVDEDEISEIQYDEIEKNYKVAKTQLNIAILQLNIVKSTPTEADLKAADYKVLQAKSGYRLAMSNGAAQLGQLEGQLELAKIQLEQNQNILQQTQTELDKLTIKSPINGTLNALFIQPGETVSMGKVVAEINDDENMIIKAYISEANIGRVKVGQVTEVFVDSESSRSFEGKIIKIGDTAEFTPKNIQTKEERMNTVFEVKIKVLNPEGVIKSGMPVDLKIKID